VGQHQENRAKYWPTDPAYITKLQKLSEAYRAEKKQLKSKLREMNSDMEQSTPVFSPRFQVLQSALESRQLFFLPSSFSKVISSLSYLGSHELGYINACSLGLYLRNGLEPKQR
jgi:hypothetical protein